MGKVIKVIDLLNMVEKKEIKDKQKFRVTFKSGMTRDIYYVESEGCNICCFKHCSDDFWWDDDEFNLNDKVEILDEEDEIDIQGIEELERFNPDEYYISGISLKNREMINNLIKTAKQLDLRLNKLESNT